MFKSDLINPIYVRQHLRRLGVTVTDALSFDLRISNVVARCAQTSYAVRILRFHGLTGPALWNVTHATLISKIMYASPAWFGFLSESCKARCQGVIQKLKCSGYFGNDFESFITLCEAADAAMFSAILCDRNHVLHQLLPPVENCNYNLRPRAHTRNVMLCNVMDTSLETMSLTEECTLNEFVFKLGVFTRLWLSPYSVSAHPSACRR